MVLLVHVILNSVGLGWDLSNLWDLGVFGGTCVGLEYLGWDLETLSGTCVGLGDFRWDLGTLVGLGDLRWDLCGTLATKADKKVGAHSLVGPLQMEMKETVPWPRSKGFSLH